MKRSTHAVHGQSIERHACNGPGLKQDSLMSLFPRQTEPYKITRPVVVDQHSQFENMKYVRRLLCELEITDGH